MSHQYRERRRSKRNNIVSVRRAEIFYSNSVTMSNNNSSSSVSKLELFQKVGIDDSIIKEEHHTYYPQTKSFNNNDEIEFIINQQDAFVSMHDSCLFISGKYTETGTTGTCTLTNNCGLYLFDSISYELNGKELERIRDPGLMATIKGFLCYSPDEIKALHVAGWIKEGTDILETIDTSTKSFTFRIPLSLIFGLFHDYKRVIRGRHCFRLVRSRNDYNCYKTDGDKRLTFQLDNVELKIQHVYPNDTIKLELMKRINKDQPILI